MRQKFAGVHVREEKGNRNNYEETRYGKPEGNGDELAFQVRETENSGKNNMRM